MEMNTLTHTKCLNLKARSLALSQLNICMQTLTPGTNDVRALYTQCEINMPGQYRMAFPEDLKI